MAYLTLGDRDSSEPSVSSFDIEKCVIDSFARVDSTPVDRGSVYVPPLPENERKELVLGSPKGTSQDTAAEDDNKRPSCFTGTFQECLFVLTTTLAVAQSSIIIGGTAVITAKIAHSLHMTQPQVTWISAAPSLAAGCFLLFFGRVADMFGRRKLFLASMVIFTILLIIVGFSPNAVFMDVFMAFTGLCSAASVPPSIGMLGAIYKPSPRKNKAFACFSAGNPLGFVVGMFISGVSTQVSSWRASFWVMAVIYGIFTASAFWTVPYDDWEHDRFNLESLKKFDYLGCVLAIAGIALFTSALTTAGDAADGWKTSYVIAILILGIALMTGFVVWQGIFKFPLMPLHIWRDKNFSLLVIILSLGFLGFSSNAFWIGLYYQEVERVSPLMVAVRMLPMAICGIAVNVVAGLIMHKVSNKLLMTIGSLAFCGCFALLSAMPANSLYWAFVFPALCLSVVGADFQFTVTNMYLMSSLPKQQQSVAGGIMQTAIRISTSVGLGITTAAFTSLSPSSSSVSTEFLPYRGTWWVALGAAGLGLVFLPFLTISKQGQKEA